MTPGLLGPRSAPADPIRIAFQVWGQSASWAELMRAGERVEALGFASLFANDHLMPILGDADGPVLGADGPVFEGWMTLGAWAARTTPSAVPYPPVASAPALQWVRMLAPRLMRMRACAPMSSHRRTSCAATASCYRARSR